MADTTKSDKKSILIVDDEPLVRLELHQIVEECGYKAEEASNSADALAMLSADSDRFEALITDICMPGTRSGTVLAGHVQYVWPHIKIIVVSAARKPLPGALPASAEFMSKPVPIPRLVACIRSLSHH